MNAKEKSILVTVGTTGFDALIDVVCSESFVDTICYLGFNRIFIQYGSSVKYFNELKFDKYHISVISFDYCPTLEPYFKQVSLVIGHAGAGTILDTLRNKLTLIVVVNEGLMGNHQHEIANAMLKENYLVKAIPDSLVKELSKLPTLHLKPYPDAHPEAFASFLDHCLHFV